MLVQVNAIAAEHERGGEPMQIGEVINKSRLLAEILARMEKHRRKGGYIDDDNTYKHAGRAVKV